jgi:hypothetical protein
MIRRVFDGLGMSRRCTPVPPLLWHAGFVLVKPLFRGANVAMGIHMMKDMTFDSAPAARDFGWNPRPLRQSMNTTVLRPLRITRSSK